MIQLRQWQLALIVVAALGLGGLVTWQATMQDDCIERDDQGECLVTRANWEQMRYEGARDDGYQDGFADGFSAQLDPCDYWTQKYTKDLDLYTRLSRPVSTPTAKGLDLNAFFATEREATAKKLADAQAKHCSKP